MVYSTERGWQDKLKNEKIGTGHIFFIPWQYGDTFENSLDQAEKYQLFTVFLRKKNDHKKGGKTIRKIKQTF